MQVHIGFTVSARNGGAEQPRVCSSSIAGGASGRSPVAWPRCDCALRRRRERAFACRVPAPVETQFLLQVAVPRDYKAV